MSLPVALTPGTTVGGHYIVGSLINSGGFGAVYRGVDTSEGHRPCAIKETYDVTPAARRQALMEASVLFTVRSKHLPEVYDAFEANGRFYLVMQLIEGQNLLQLLRVRIAPTHLGTQQPHVLSQGPCSEQEVLSWLLPIMEVLQELHSRNPAVMHRDIKPGNIVLTPQHSAVLVDFGLTKLYDPQSNGTQSLVKAVSEGFSPLEQYLGRTCPQSDIYSMAATIYLLLTNRLPPAATVRHVQDTLIAPRLINPAISPKMERALLKGLAVNADQRYLNMREFAEALTQQSFTAHADRTIAVAPVSGKQTVPVRSYVGVASRPAQHQGVLRTPIPPPMSVPSPVVPVYAPPFQMKSSYTRRLPGSSSQGCLWGVVQGILAAILVLLLKKEPYFYLTILMGFAFYTLAGFMTARRGGASIRGAWAGAWAGVISTVMFWVALLFGLLFAFVQRLQAITSAAQRHGIAVSSSAAGRAWRAVLPDFLTHQAITPGQSAATTILIALGIGLVIAFVLGWIGGSLARSRHKTFMLKLRQPLTS